MKGEMYWMHVKKAARHADNSSQENTHINYWSSSSSSSCLDAPVAPTSKRTSTHIEHYTCIAYCVSEYIGDSALFHSFRNFTTATTTSWQLQNEH